MLGVITRVLLNPLDYVGVTKVTRLTLKEKTQESGDVYSFIFSSDKLPKWKAGQHAIFTLPGKKVSGKTWRPFSVACAPHEEEVRIGTTIPLESSSFKRYLNSLQPGDTVRMFGPYGELYIRSKMKRGVGLAGGIGITPFRAIISDLAKRKSNLPFTLIYSAAKEHVYKDELEKWSASLPNLEIIYPHTAEEVKAELVECISKYGHGAHYMLSGAPKMIKALRRELRSRRIKKSQIRNDPFKGY